MYGTWGSSIPGNGATIALLSFGTTFKLWNGTTQVAVTGVTCQVGTPIHFKLIIRQAGGADVYLNNSVTANGSLRKVARTVLAMGKKLFCLFY
jgi:hypothetical protein